MEGEEKRDLAAISPLQQAARLRVPVLIAHGELDANVPADQGRQMVKALKARGASVQSAFYPTAGHGFALSADSVDFMKRVEAFLEVHNPAHPAPASGPRDPRLVAGAVVAADAIGSSRKKPSPGAMELRYLVTADGRVMSCQVTDSSGAGEVDRRGCELAEQQLQYLPALGVDGRPKEEWLTYRVVFEAAKDK